MKKSIFLLFFAYALTNAPIALAEQGSINEPQASTEQQVRLDNQESLPVNEDGVLANNKEPVSFYKKRSFIIGSIVLLAAGIVACYKYIYPIYFGRLCSSTPAIPIEHLSRAEAHQQLEAATKLLDMVNQKIESAKNSTEKRAFLDSYEKTKKDIEANMAKLKACLK